MKTQAMWTSPSRVYADKDGNVVDAKDPSRATLVVPAGGQIPMAQAVTLGLVKAAEEMAVQVAANTKAVMGTETVNIGGGAPTVEPEAFTEDVPAEGNEIDLTEKALEPAEDKAEKPHDNKAVKPKDNKGK